MRYLEVQKHLGFIFKFLAKNKEQLHTLLFYGIRGVGKYSFIKHIIKMWNCPNLDCSCQTCQKIDSGNSSDILEFTSGEPIQEFRNKINEFYSNTTKEMEHKYLILRNLDFYTPDIMDVLLKTLEDRKNFQIFATSSCSEKIRPAVLSRFQSYYVTPLTPHDLKRILENDKVLHPYLGSLEKSTFGSVFEVDCFVRYNFEDLFDLLHNKVKSPTEVLAAVDILWRPIKDLKVCDKLPILEYFIGYYTGKVLQISPEIYKQYLRKVLLRFSDSLFSNLQNPQYYSNINLENQLQSLFLSLFILKSVI